MSQERVELPRIKKTTKRLDLPSIDRRLLPTPRLPALLIWA
jgi:hypothetical protein